MFSTAEWTLDVEGNKSGPYTPEQILGLFEDGEILAHHLVNSPRFGNDWIVVEELVSAMRSAPLAGPAMNASATGPHSSAQKNHASVPFTPPPRPSALLQAAEDHRENFTPTHKSNDASFTLFNVLISARERKIAQKNSLNEAETPPQVIRFWKKIPPQTWIISSLVLIAVVVFFSVWRVQRPSDKATALRPTTPVSTTQPTLMKPASVPTRPLPMTPSTQNGLNSGTQGLYSPPTPVPVTPPTTAEFIKPQTIPQATHDNRDTTEDENEDVNHISPDLTARDAQLHEANPAAINHGIGMPNNTTDAPRLDPQN